MDVEMQQPRKAKSRCWEQYLCQYGWLLPARTGLTPVKAFHVRRKTWQNVHVGMSCRVLSTSIEAIEHHDPATIVLTSKIVGTHFMEDDKCAGTPHGGKWEKAGSHRVQHKNKTWQSETRNAPYENNQESKDIAPSNMNSLSASDQI